jgi:hypothetical protein
MSIPPISGLNLAASIAGTDRAAGIEVASGRANSSSGAGPVGTAESGIEQTEKINKSDLSGDSDADGRQMLDTFERHNRDDSQPNESNNGDQVSSSSDAIQNPNVTFNRPTLGGHIDLCG